MDDREQSPVDGDRASAGAAHAPGRENQVAATPAELQEPAPVCYYDSLGEFADWLLEVYRRSTRGHARVFCPEWWKHPEAVARMDALWRAFEQLRQDPGTGMSVFWRDHVDHHMTVLLDADGPFKGCEDGHSDYPLEAIAQATRPSVLFERDERGLPPLPDNGDRAPIHAGAGAAPGYTQTSARRP